MSTYDNGVTQFEHGFSTRAAAKKIGCGFRTLNRWLSDGLICASAGVALEHGRCLWIWNDADVARGKKLKATLRPGRKPSSVTSAESNKGDS
jgi:hypothetical protein